MIKRRATGPRSLNLGVSHISLRATFMAAALVMASGATSVFAQVTIDGTSETVIGGGSGTQSSPWSVGDDLVIGNTGTGSLSISNGGVGGVVNNVTSGFIGFSNTGIGMVTVDGAGSTWELSSTLHVGDDGSGSLTISNSGFVDTNGVGIIGNSSGSTGTVTVDGSGSEWELNNNSLIVGQAGSGSLSISDGGVVDNAAAGIIGRFSGSTGTVTVDGIGSRLETSGNLFFGTSTSSTGTLTISNGGVVDTGFDAHIQDTGTGAIVVDGSGSQWNVANNLFVGNSVTGGTATLTISNGGEVSSATADIGVNTANTGILNIGAASGDAAQAPGTLDTTGLIFGAGNARLVFNHTAVQGDGYAFGADISSGTGTHAINHLAGFTDYTGDGSGFTGTTTVSGGTLYVNDSLGGTINLTGGRLGGAGTLGALTLGNGSTLAPGNSVGILNASGTTFNSGSIYEVELNDGGFVAGTNNDLLNDSGTVTINSGAAVHVTPENGTDDGTTYMPGTTYTIVTAGSVSGTFDTRTDDYSFLNFALGYDTSNVYLTSSLAELCLAGFTSNQCATADAVETLGSGNAVLAAIANLTSGEAAAMDALSGEVHASARTALIEDSRFLREAADGRVRAAFGNTPTDKGMDLWAHGFGAGGSWASDGNAARLGRSIGGLFIGGDAAVSDDIRLGVLAGYSGARFDAADRASTGSASNYHIGLYGGGQWGDFRLRGGASHSWHSIDVSRTVAFTGFADALSTAYGARILQVFGEAGYGFTAAGAKFEPYAGLAHVRLNTDGFAETGGAAALAVEGGMAAITFATIGLRAETSVTLGGSEAKLRGGIAWRHALGDVPASIHRFASGGDAFAIAGVPVARNALLLEAGLDVKLTPAAAFGVSYSGQLGSGLSDHAAKASLGMRF